MKCKRCDEPGAERMEMQFRSDAVLVVYLCRDCVEDVSREDHVSELVPSRIQ